MPTPIVQPALLGGGFRIVTYEFVTGAFTGTTYELTLKYPLSSDYFVMITGHYNNNLNGSNASVCQVYQDPFATGALTASSGNDKLGLRRWATGLNSWLGTVTVVENLSPGSADGFQLLDVRMPFFPTGTVNPQDITATSATPWTDINKVVLFGGWRGGGARLQGSGGNEYVEWFSRIWPSGTDTINLRRRSNSAITNYSPCDTTVYIVEWGSNWNVQRIALTGTNAGAGVDATGEYNTGAISSVLRDNTWVWASGTHDGGGTGGSINGRPMTSVITLGDGVNQNTSETSVAAGTELNVGFGKDLEIYTMTHSSLSVDYRFHTDADDATPFNQTVDAAIKPESYNEASNPRTTDGARLGLVYASSDPSTTPPASDHWKALHWQRHTAGSTLTLVRKQSGAEWAGWIQSVDFGNFQ